MRKMILLGLALLATTAALPASASVYGDDLTKCVVGHTSPADNTTLMKWMFVAMAASPTIKSMANVTDAQRSEANKAVGELIGRLLTRDCRAQTVAALKYDGPEAIKTAFGLFGQSAMAGLMRDPAVEASMGGMTSAFDRKAFDDVLREAGLKPPAI